MNNFHIPVVIYKLFFLMRLLKHVGILYFIDKGYESFSAEVQGEIFNFISSFLIACINSRLVKLKRMGVCSGSLCNRLESEENKTTRKKPLGFLGMPLRRIWLRKRNSRRKGGSGGFNVGHQDQKSLLRHRVLGTSKSVRSKANVRGVGQEERKMFILALVLYVFITTLCLLAISSIA